MKGGQDIELILSIDRQEIHQVYLTQFSSIEFFCVLKKSENLTCGIYLSN